MLILQKILLEYFFLKNATERKIIFDPKKKQMSDTIYIFYLELKIMNSKLPISS